MELTLENLTAEVAKMESITDGMLLKITARSSAIDMLKVYFPTGNTVSDWLGGCNGVPVEQDEEVPLGCVKLYRKNREPELIQIFKWPVIEWPKTVFPVG